ncbi:hypothetical protein [Mycetocola saprophilus]|uniref:hypothetical protein n=1 Tax=Mycetocola saprophilus TaxID=76636 RepID=UPI0004BEB158|nr:hypothetical protein [Mycetocola saprophilus]
MTRLILEIKGDSDSIHAMATWLGDRLSQTVKLAVRGISAGGTESAFVWEGESGSEFRSLCERISDMEPGIEQFANDVAEVFRACAGRIERGREKFTRMLDYAKGEGLTVRGNEILYPLTDMMSCPADNAPREDIDRWNAYARRIKTFQEIAGEVGKWHGEHSAWAAEHLIPLLSQAGKQAEFSEIFEKMEVNNADLFQDILELNKGALSESLREMREASVAMQEAADGFSKQLRSGNPALRAAAEEANPKAMNTAIEVMNEKIGAASRYLKVLPVAGYAVEIVSTVDELAKGGSQSSVGVGLLGGAAGAATGGAVATAATASATSVVAIVGIPVGAAVAGAFFIGQGAIWLWEAAVPLDIRESIDAGIARGFEVAASANY